VAVPIHLRNLLLVAALVILLHWALWYYLDVQGSWDRVALEVATGGFVGILFTAVPRSAKRWVSDKTAVVLASSALTKSLVTFALVACVIAATLSRGSVDIPIGEDTVLIDGEPFHLGVSKTKYFYRPSFTLVKIEIGETKKELRLVPIYPRRLSFDEAQLETHSGLYLGIRDLLLASHFQFLENRFLTRANELISTAHGTSFKELAKVLPILKLCFVENDNSSQVMLDIEAFEREFSLSNWTPLLNSCARYSERRFDLAVRQLETPDLNLPAELRSTYLFFRGVNRLKLMTQIAGEGGAWDNAEVEAALSDFIQSKQGLPPESFFSSIAVPSADIFYGITCVYVGKFDEALERFKAASAVGYSGLRSRAFNDIGFVNLLKGDLNLARDAFEKALSFDGTYPLARVNLGYVLLAQGEYEQARAILEDVVADQRVKSESYRDTLLAKAALAHLKMLSVKDAPDPDVYNDILDKLNLFKFENEKSIQLRLAQIHLTLAEKLYTGEKYYGLEIFALAMQAHAYLEAKNAAEEGLGPRAEELAARALTAFSKLKSSINNGWFSKKNTSSFFAPVDQVMAVLATQAHQ
jgi:tetratricopeptide (TPR) repeat protein